MTHQQTLRNLKHEGLEVGMSGGANIEMPHHSSSRHWVSHMKALLGCLFMEFSDDVLTQERQNISTRSKSVHL